MCRSNQDLVLSLDVSCESRSLCSGVWWHTGWLSVPDRGLSSKVEENPSGVDFSNRRNLQVAAHDA